MAKKINYTAECFLIYSDTGKVVAFDDLDPEELKRVRSIIAERFGKAVSDYCQLHPGTFSTIPAVKEVKIDV